MNNISLQIQTVLYKNSLEPLMRSLKSIQNAIRICRDSDIMLSDVRFCYGDASPNPLFDDETIKNIQREYENYFSFSYNFFGFNSGSAKGHNVLGVDCDTDYMLLMNPDILFCPRFLVEVLRPFDEIENVGIVEGRQTPVEHPKDYDKDTGETSWSSGACTFIKTDLFHKVGGYDSDTFFMYCDDVDLSWRIRLLGKKIIYQPRAMVFHAKRLSEEGSWQPTDAEAYYSMEAALYMLYKWSDYKQYKKLLKTLSNSVDESTLKVVREFKTREKNGEMPKPVKNAEMVTTFTGNNYMPTRFTL